VTVIKTKQNGKDKQMYCRLMEIENLLSGIH